MNKRYLRPVMAGVVFLVLLGWALTQERGRAPEKGEAFGLDIATVSRFEVISHEKKLILEKRDDQWFLVEPLQGYADTEAVERIVKLVAELKPSGSRRDEKLTDDKFGLQEPDVTVTLGYGKGKTARLMLGKETPGGSELYARIEGRDTLYFVPLSLRTQVQEPAESLRDKVLAHFEAADVQSVQMQFSDRALTLERRGTPPQEKWMITQPFEAKADEWAVKQVVDRLASLRAEDFAPAKPEKDKEDPFAKPSLRATVKTKDGKSYVLEMGGKTRQAVAESAPEYGAPSPPMEKDLVYARLQGREEVLLLNESQTVDLFKTDMDLRDKRLLEVARDQIMEIRVERKQGVSFAARRLPDGWQITSPTNLLGKANTEKINDIVWDLAELEAREYLGEKENLQEYGLVLPETVITITVKGQSQPIKVHLGYAKGEDTHYARTSQSKEIYVVGDTLLLDLPKTAGELKPSTTEATPATPTMPTMPTS